MRRTWRALALALLIGLAAGVGMGFAFGRFVWPVRYYDAEVSDLSPTHKDAFVVMVSAAFAESGDLSEAREALSLIDVADIGEYLQAVSERLLAAHDSRSAGLVARLAQTLGSR